MPLILNIETSTNVCSASLSENGKIIAIKESFDDRSHASALTIFIDQIFTDKKLKYKYLDAVSVSEGPGSYTGLRIGVSVAKGICYSQNKPLIAVNTLKAMTAMALDLVDSQIMENSYFCPMIDARRMEAYTALFDKNLNEIKKTEAEIINEKSYSKLLQTQNIYFFGNGSLKFENTIKHPNSHFLKDIYASAKYMANLAEKAFEQKKFKDLAYFEPFYLKDFVALTSKKNLLKE